MPKHRHLEYASLNAADQDTVSKLGGIVRLADALDRNHDSRVQSLECAVEPNRFVIGISSPANCENELAEIERKRDLFEQAFSRTLTVSSSKKKVKVA